MLRDLGDFQTPPSLVSAVLQCLTKKGQSWTRVLEPTCGTGNFIKGLLDLETPPKEIWGIELQNMYVQYAQNALQSTKSTSVIIKQANIFDVDLRRDLAWKTGEPLLIIGNPPWVTNSELGLLESINVPYKSNFKGFSGFEAMTGESNFDIAEYILLKLIREYSAEQPTIALLCKTSVARNILQFASNNNLPVIGASIRRFESKRFFGAFVDACLFCIEIGFGTPRYQAEVYDDLFAAEPSSIVGIREGRLIANMETNQKFSFLDGVCPLIWRQGTKHDAATIMELVYDTAGKLHNKLGEVVDIEPEYIYPLLKSSDLGGAEKIRQKKAMIVPQKYIGEDTTHLEYAAPRLWKYLLVHQGFFDKRKSSIYKNQPLFAIFGVGAYTFAPYKVAISGMYKKFQFRTIGSVNEKPVVFDDTCYFIPCISAEQAAFIASLLHDPLCLDFLHSLVFWDAKRPVTKKLLQRVNLTMLLQHVDMPALLVRANSVLQTIEGARLDRYKEYPENLAIFLEDHFSASVKAAKQVI